MSRLTEPGPINQRWRALRRALRGSDVAAPDTGYDLLGRTPGNALVLSPATSGDSRVRATLFSDLALAIDSAEICADFQPMVDPADQRLIAFDVHCHWLHPAHGMIDCDRLWPLADAAGLAGALARHLFARALTAVPQWPCAVSLIMPLGASRLYEPGLVDALIAIVQDCGVAPSRVRFALAEDSDLAEPEAIARIHALREAGNGIILDRFGQHLGALRLLRDLPLHSLRLHASLGGPDPTVPGDDRADHHHALFAASIALARGLGLEVMVCGLDHRDRLPALAAAGVSGVQGDGLLRPISAKAAATYARSGQAHARDARDMRRLRLPVEHPASASFNGRIVTLRVRNIGSHGAEIETDDDLLLPIDHRLAVDFGEAGMVGGRVRWSRSGRFGLEFDQPFDPARLIVLP